jgi:hypothetical protein
VGLLRCRYDISREHTQAIANDLDRYEHASRLLISAAATVACLPVGGIGSVICGAAAGAAGRVFVDKAEQAAADDACLGLFYKLVQIPLIKVHKVVALPDVGVDNGPTCHNS